MPGLAGDQRSRSILCHVPSSYDGVLLNEDARLLLCRTTKNRTIILSGIEALRMHMPQGSLHCVKIIKHHLELFSLRVFPLLCCERTLINIPYSPLLPSSLPKSWYDINNNNNLTVFEYGVCTVNTAVYNIIIKYILYQSKDSFKLKKQMLYAAF